MNSTPTGILSFQGSAQHMAGVGSRPRLPPGLCSTSLNPCAHGVRDRGRFCKKCPGRGICPKTMKQKTMCKCGDDGCGAALCPHGVWKYTCKREGCLEKATSICEHGRNKYLCLKGSCPGYACCKHGKVRATCSKCKSAKICEPLPAEEPLTKKTKRFHGSASCPGEMWPMGPRRLQPLA